VLEILAEAARWTRARGYENWPERFSRRFVASHAAACELFLVELDTATVATLTLQWSDLRFWGETAPDAGYVHRLAVRRAHAGRGLGHRLLEWADEQAIARGCEFLRLDVVSDNAPLRGYYEQVGFAHQRDVEGEEHLPDGTRWAWRTSLYERPCRGDGAR
jgi:ribosomal protein S18 acetylase RimI-like enzyme